MLTFTAWLQLGSIIALELAPIFLLSHVGTMISPFRRNVGRLLLNLAGVCVGLSIVLTATVPYTLLPDWVFPSAILGTAAASIATGIVLVREYVGFKARVEAAR